MDKDTWLAVKETASEFGYTLTAREVPVMDFFTPAKYLFMSGIPCDLLWKLIRCRSKGEKPDIPRQELFTDDQIVI
ncbi:MAG: hypothetical protein ACW99G_19290 [Candidatus Thorarchaeota archaeon]